MSYLSDEVYRILKKWLRIQWKEDRERYIAQEQRVISITGNEQFMIDMIDKAFIQQSTNIDWGNRAIIFIELFTIMAQYLLLGQLIISKPLSYNETWETF